MNKSFVELVFIIFLLLLKQFLKHSLNKKPTIEFDLTSLDNDIEITKISINYDETKDRISNVLSNTNKTVEEL